MITTVFAPLRQPLAMAAFAALFAACAEEAPLAPGREAANAPQLAVVPPESEANRMLARLRRATDRYHNLDVAIADGFVHLHDCEVRPGEGPVGIVYIHPGRIGDAVIDPSLPEGLIYAPGRNGRRPKLVGAELVVPYAFWHAAEPPTFLGVPFQGEDEFGVFGLHVWIWRHNPDGLFAESNPEISCD
jgi:hypothetical protein